MASVKYILDRACLFGTELSSIGPFVIITSMNDTETNLCEAFSLDDALMKIKYEIYGDSGEEDPYTKFVKFYVVDRNKKILYTYDRHSETLKKTSQEEERKSIVPIYVKEKVAQVFTEKPISCEVKIGIAVVATAVVCYFFYKK